jgi:hypothetical protein
MAPCRRCAGEVVPKSRTRLALVGTFFLTALGLGLLWWPLWFPAVFLAMIGGYLLAWATVGQGLWCRGCKRFDGV